MQASVSGGNARQAADWKGTAQFLGACAGDFGETIRGRARPVGEMRVDIIWPEETWMIVCFGFGAANILQTRFSVQTWRRVEIASGPARSSL